MAVVNPMLTPMFNPNVKDSRWLTLEVCREFQRTKCSRSENECKFAHPPPHVEVQNGRVTCCFDSIKGKCQRKEPPCKYLHPPQHLREQLLQNGRNNLILKNLQMQYIAAGLQPAMIPSVFSTAQADQAQGQNSASPEYRASPNTPTYYTYEQVPPYIISQSPSAAAAAAAFTGQYGLGPAAATMATTQLPATMISTVDGGAAAAAAAIATTTSAGAPGAGGVLSAGTKITRPDRLESSSANGNGAGATNGATDPSVSSSWTPSSSVAVNGGDSSSSTTPSPQYSHVYFQQNNMGALQGMVPMMKRPALDTKSGIPMYQPNTTAYQQAALAMQLQQQPFHVPVSTTSAAAAAAAVSLRQPLYGSYSPYLEQVAGHPPSVPRF